MVILVIHTFAQIIRTVVCRIIGTKQIIIHIQISLIAIAVVHSSQHSQSTPVTTYPATAEIHTQAEVCHRLTSFNCPVIVQPVIQ